MLYYSVRMTATITRIATAMAVLLSVAIFTTTTAAAAQAIWSDPIVVLDGGERLFSHPQVASNGDSLTAAWWRSDGENHRVEVRSSSDAGVTWSPSITLSEAGQHATEHRLAVSATDQAVVWERSDGANSRVQVSTAPQGGAWSSPYSLSLPGQDARSPHIATDGATMVAVWSRSGNGDNVNGSLPFIEASASTNGGASWSAPVRISAIGGWGLYPQVAIDGDVVTVVWIRSDADNNFRVQASTSTDRGFTWNEPVTLSAMGGTAFGPQLVSGGGVSTVVWHADSPDSGGIDRVQSAFSIDNGSSWSEPVNLSASASSSQYPRIVNDGSRITVAWTRQGQPGYLLQRRLIEVTHSADGGLSWSTPATVSAIDRGTNDPEIATNGQSILVVWEQYDGSVRTAQYAASPDAGETWTSPAIVSQGLLPQIVFSRDSFTVVMMNSGVIQAQVASSASRWGVGSAPQGLTATPGSRVVLLGWAAPAQLNGGTVRDYIVQYRLGTSGAWLTFEDGADTTTSTTVTGLSVGERYWFKVSAVTEFGTGPESSAATSVVLPPLSVRVAGADRYTTSVAISQQAFPPGFSSGVPVLFVASGANFPDALSAGPVISKLGGPVLLTAPAALPMSVRDEIVRLNPAKIVVIGGEGAVSATVFSQLQALAPDVERLGGASRYETSRLVTSYGFGELGASVAYVAGGEGFADALAAGAAAGSKDAPIILVPGRAQTVDSATLNLLQELGVTQIFVVGGEGAVSAGVESSLETVAPVTRLAGADRLATAQAVNREAFDDAQRVYLAYAFNFPDALGGGVLATVKPGPLFTVPGSCVPSAVLSEIDRIGATKVVLLGGSGVLSSGVEALSPCA